HRCSRHTHSFFECSPDHVDLHPFPTRRSSDLRVWRARAPVLLRRGGASLLLLLSLLIGYPAWGQQSRTALHDYSRDLWTSRNGLDRKSTRLNSSHVKISYAVFCLKKKN